MEQFSRQCRSSCTSQTDKPSAAVTVQSVVNLYPDYTIAVMLAVIGADERNCCHEIKQEDSLIRAPDQAGCDKHAMTNSVVNAGLGKYRFCPSDIANNIGQRI